MSFRVCTGCGRRVPLDMPACLACGTDVRDDVLVSTVTTGPLPPAPPALLVPVWEHPAPVDPVWGGAPPATAPRPALSSITAVVRFLAVAGHLVIAGYFVLSVGLAMLVMVIGLATVRDLGSVGSLGVGVVFTALMAAWLASRTRRLARTYDGRRFVGAVPGDVVVVALMGGAFAIGGGRPLLLFLVAIPAAVALVTLAAGMLLPRPLTDAA